MIQEVKMYKCTCDNCGEDIAFEDGWIIFATRQTVQDWIENEEGSMQVIDGKHICSECIVCGEDGDEIDLTRKKETV